MAYEHKPGTGSLLRNTYKDKDTQPDWRGDGALPDGTVVEIAIWEGQTSGGLPRLSVTFNEPRQQRGGGGDTQNYAPRPEGRQRPQEDFSSDTLADDVPFVDWN